PLGILDVGLAAGHLPDVLGVDQQQFKDPLEQVPDRLPVDPGRLHGDVGHPFVGQPVRQLQQGVGLGPEGAYLPVDPATAAAADTGYDHLLVDIQTGATGMQDVHTRPPTRPVVGAATSETIYSACSPTVGGDNLGCVAPPRARLTCVLRSTSATPARTAQP